MLNVFEAFAGYGSQRMALKNLGIEHKVVAISEIDKFAIASYEAIHGETNNLGDISKIDVNDIPEHDLLTYSFPCQDISIAGNLGGFDKKSGTRSSLLWETNRIIEHIKPKYLLMENVKNLIGKKFMPGFVEWISHLEELGYSNYWEVLNAKDFGVPQNRERVFMVSILGEHEPYIFPKPIKLNKRLKDVLADEVDEKYYLSKEIQERFLYNPNFKNEIKVLGTTDPNASIGQKDITYSKEGIVGALTATDFKQPKQIGIEQITRIDTEKRKNISAYRTYSAKGLAPTLNTMQGGGREPHVVETSIIQKARGYNKGGEHKISPSITSSSWQENNLLKNNYRIRKLTPLECWRLMDVKDEDFYKAQKVNSNTQLYKQAGNSIVVSVLEAIFRNMFLEVPEKDLIGEHIPLF